MFHTTCSTLFLTIFCIALVLLPSSFANNHGLNNWKWKPVGKTVTGFPETHAAWDLALDTVWNKSSPFLSYCLGNDRYKVLSVLESSFPLPLPVGPADDVVCGNRTVLYRHLCTPEEMNTYYQYILRTDNVEKIPNNIECETGKQAPQCAPGFFKANTSIHTGPHACCPGYFCPVMLTCMIPCPMGSYCPRAVPAEPPHEFVDHLHDLPGSSKNHDKWCAPYAYKERQGQGCGGADKWPILPTASFPGFKWANGSGSIFCDAGHYCPNTTSKLTCTKHHYCRQGSTDMEWCPPLVSCPKPGLATPSDNYVGVAVDSLLFLLLAVMWHLSRVYNRLMRKLSKRERLRITWKQFQPQLSIIRVMNTDASEGASDTGSARPLTATVSGSLGAAAARPTGSCHRRSRSADLEAACYARLRQPLLRSDSLPMGGRGVGVGRGVDMLGFWRRLGTGARGEMSASSSGQGPVWANVEMCPEANSGLDRNGASFLGEGSSPLGSSNDFASPFSPGPQPFSPTPLPRGGGQSSQTNTKEPLQIDFIDLSLRLKACGAKVLQSVSGQLRAARLTAIMGPSGAGKTTLMNTLAGKATYGQMSGTVYVNGRRDSLERYKAVMGFVPQDDVMYRNLTVEENLLFSARVRLPASFCSGDHVYFVEKAIQVLGLLDVRNALIGDEETRGISGGQRKRVNIGLELVADPWLLFLDEPTSGLDSSASKMIVAGLAEVAHLGVTTAAVVHQPSHEVCCMFDDVILLAKGGQTVYYGPVDAVENYFWSLGFDIPNNMNPADAYLDIITGHISATRPPNNTPDAPVVAHPDLVALWGKEAPRPIHALRRCLSTESLVVQDSPAQPAPLSTLPGRVCQITGVFLWCIFLYAKEAWSVLKGLCGWQRTVHVHQSHTGPSALPPITSQADLQELQGLLGSAGGGLTGSGNVPLRQTPGFWRQYRWCLSRAILRRTREPLLIFTEYAIFALTGSMLGMLSSQGRRDILHFAGDVMYTIVALGLLGTVSGLKTLGRDKVVFYREAASGLNKMAAFWAYDTWDQVGTLLRGLCYLTTYYSISQPRAVLWQMYFVTVAILYCCTGMAYVLSVIMVPSSAQLTAAVVALINALIAHQHNPQGVVKLAYNLSFARWGLEGYVISEANRLVGVWLLVRCADLQYLDYDVNRFWYSIGMLGLIGMGCRLLACLGLHVLNRDKMQ